MPGDDGQVDTTADPQGPLALLYRNMRTSEQGLSGREAQRRLAVYGSNELVQRTGRRWPRELAKQITHPLALLLMVAALLAMAAGTPVLTAAIAAVIMLNAGFAFVQATPGREGGRGAGGVLANARQGAAGPAPGRGGGPQPGARRCAGDRGR